MKILFMCAVNSVRSQLAEGIARKYLPEHSILSAGASSSHVNPTVVDVLMEVENVDANNHTSKSVYDIDQDGIDLVIAVCAESVIPSELLQKPHQQWPFEVPGTRSGLIELAQVMKKKILELKQTL